jgi:hypothetical protein
MLRTQGRKLLIIALAIALLPVAYSVFSTGVGLAYLTLPVLAIVGIAWFVWRVFLRVYVRAVRIAHIRERRELLEASLR